MTTYPPPSEYRFRAGPYVAPTWRVGARVQDEWAGEVEVTGKSEAPIPWPTFTYRAHPMPVLTGDLVRAVVEEPEMVVAHFFGVSRYHITRWRKAIAGTDNSREVHALLALKRQDPKFRQKYHYK